MGAEKEDEAEASEVAGTSVEAQRQAHQGEEEGAMHGMPCASLSVVADGA